MLANDDSSLPLTVVGRTPLRAADITTPVPSAQVKSAILLAGLRAKGRTTVRERVATRDHTERMLRARGVPVDRVADPGGGVAWSMQGGMAVQAIDQQVPGDVSAAAFWLVAGSIHPDAELALRDVGVNPTRRAIIDLLRAMGAAIEERPVDVGVAGPAAAAEAAAGADAGEPMADLVVRSSDLRAINLGSADVAAAIDEIPVLCLAAAFARGTTTIRGAGELRHKESDRIAGIAAGLTAMGARVEVDGDDLRIHGGTPLHGAITDSLDDHRLAMTFAIAGLAASDPMTIERPGRPRSPIPASLATSKGCEHDEARRPHRPPGGPFLCPARCSRPPSTCSASMLATSCGIAPDRPGRRDRRAARGRLPRRQRDDPPQGAGGPDGRPAHRGSVVTGAVNTLTREGKRLIGHNTDVAGFKVALDKLVGRQKMPRQAVILGAGGGGRAVVYGLVREGFQRIVVFNRHLHRAEGLVKHFGRTAAHMELRAMPWHRIDHRVRAGQDQGAHQRDVHRPDERRQPIPAEALHDGLLVLDSLSIRRPACCATRRPRARRWRTGVDVAPSGAAASRCGPVSRHRSNSCRPSSRRLSPAGCGPPRANRPAKSAAVGRVTAFRFLTAGECTDPHSVSRWRAFPPAWR